METQCIRHWLRCYWLLRLPTITTIVDLLQVYASCHNAYKEGERGVILSPRMELSFQYNNTKFLHSEPVSGNVKLALQNYTLKMLQSTVW